MPKSSKAISSRLAAAALSIVSLSSCGDGTVHVRVNVEGIPAGTKTLSIKSYVDTQTYNEQLFDVSSGDKTLVAGMLLPANTRGTFKAEVSPLDSAGKALQTCGVEYGGSGSRDILGDRDTSVNVTIAINFPDAGITGNLYGVWGSKSDDVWVVGDSGLTARWNGCYWQRVASGTTVSLKAIHGFSANNIWVVGGDTPSDANVMVLHWDGATWKTQQPSTPIPGMLSSVWGSSSTQLWATGQGPAAPLFVSGSGGTTWITALNNTDMPLPDAYTGISGFDPSHIYISGKATTKLGGCGIGYDPPCIGEVTYFETGTPNKWTRVSGGSLLIGNLTAVFAESANRIWFGGVGGFVASWDGTTAGIPKTMTNINLATKTLPSAMASLGVKAIRSFPGATQPPGPFVVVPAASNSSDLYRLDAGTVNKLTAQPSQLDHPVNAMWGTSPTDLWLVGDDGARYRYDGASFKKYLAPL